LKSKGLQVLKTNRIKATSVSLFTVFALVSACEPQNNLVPQPDIIGTNNRVTRTQLKGTVEFPDRLGIKASTADITTQSTVSIIYLPTHATLPNRTVATGLTDGSGNFTINPSVSFAPAVNDAFILEAEKRIGRGGQEKLAISTYIRWNGTGWDSMTTPGIKINSKTTALTIIAGLNTGTITVANTISKIVNGVPQGINGTVTGQTILDVSALVTTVLSFNSDPVHYIGFQNSNYLIVNPQNVLIGEYRVNTYITNQQVLSSIAADSDGDFVITWQSFGQDAIGALGVFAQRYNKSGIPQGPEFQVNTYTTGDQVNQKVAMDSNGDFVITWYSSDFQDGSYGGIYAQRYNNAGVAQIPAGCALPKCNPATGEFRVNTTTTANQFEPNIAMDSDGDFVIAWRSPDGSQTGVFAQKFNNVGVAQIPPGCALPACNPATGEFRVNTYTTNTQSEPDIAMDSNGNFVISWSSNTQDGENWGIYAQRYNADGSKPGANGAEFKVNTYTSLHQVGSSVAMDSDGDFVVSWASFYQDGSNYGIYAQRYNNAGTPQSTEFKVSTAFNNNQSIAGIAMDNDGDFVITWRSNLQDGSLYGIYAKRYNATGTAQGAEFIVNTYTTNSQNYPVIAMDSTGNFIISWASKNQDSSDYGIYARRYNASGTPQ
jgi:hypothetical protein